MRRAGLGGRPPHHLADRWINQHQQPSSIRVAALASLRIKHVDLAEKSVTQNPREVATKLGKRIDTFFARGFEDAKDVLAQWIKHLDEVELYGPDDPLFPSTALCRTQTQVLTATDLIGDTGKPPNLSAK